MTDPSGLVAMPNAQNDPMAFASYTNGGGCFPKHSGECKIEIAGIDVISDWFGQISQLGAAYSGGFGHLLIIFTSETGVEYEYRGGPIISPRQREYCSGSGPSLTNTNNPFGMLCASSLEFNPTTGVDAQFALNLRRQTLMEGKNACQKRSCLDWVVGAINNLQINYSPTPGITDNWRLSPHILTAVNSNTFAMTMIENCDIPFEEFTNDFSARWYPGVQYYIQLPTVA